MASRRGRLRKSIARLAGCRSPTECARKRKIIRPWDGVNRMNLWVGGQLAFGSSFEWEVEDLEEEASCL